MNITQTTRLAKMLYALNYRGRYCKICNRDGFDNPWIMEFHHRDPSTKNFTLSKHLKSATFKYIKDELDKCDVLCSHCHQTFHAREALQDYITHKTQVLSKFDELVKLNGGIKKLGLSFKYSKEEVEKLINDGHTIKTMASSLGEDYRTTQALLTHYGLSTKTQKRPRIPTEKSIVRDYVVFAYSMTRMCSKYSMAEKDMTDLLVRNNVRIRPPGKIARHLDVSKLRELFDEGLPKNKIASILNCTEVSVYRALKRNNIK